MESPAPRPLAHTLSYHALKNPTPMSLPALADRLETIEALENPDLNVELSSLRAGEDQSIIVPGHGPFEMTSWARKQLAVSLGCRFDKYFENASPEAQAFELNHRLARAQSEVKLRSCQNPHGMPILRAFVSPTYQPISDSFVAHMILSALRRSEDVFPVMRVEISEVSTSYSIQIGAAHEATVGTIFGTLQIFNSGTGYSSLRITCGLLRKICANGMCIKAAEANLLTRRHQGQVETQLWDKISTRLVGIGDKLARGVKSLEESRNILVADPQQEIEAVLRRAHLPKRLVAPLTAAFQKEPHPSAFGISQAITDAQTHQDLGLTPEERLQLEDAAGSYLHSVTHATM